MENNQLINIDKLPELLKHDYTFIDCSFTLQKFINIPYENFINNPPHLSKNKPIYLICYSGKKSLYLANELSKKGYHAYSFNGGFYAVEHPINNQLY